MADFFATSIQVGNLKRAFTESAKGDLVFRDKFWPAGLTLTNLWEGKGYQILTELDIPARLTQAEDDIDSLEIRVGDLETLTTNHELRIDDLETEFANLDFTYATDQNLANISAYLQGQITSNDGDISLLQSQTQTISGDLNILEQQFADLDFTYATDINLANVSAYLQGQVTDHENRLTTIENADFGHIIVDEGIDLPYQTRLNFVGDAIAVTDNVGISATDVTIDAYTTTQSDTILSNVSGNLEGQIANIDLTPYATVISLSNASGNLQGQIDSLNLDYATDINLANVSAYLQGQVTDHEIRITDIENSEFGHVVQDEGIDLAYQPRLNFIGDAVTATDNIATSASDITIDAYTTAQVDQKINFGNENLVGISGYLLAQTLNGDLYLQNQVDSLNVTLFNVSGNLQSQIDSLNLDYATDVNLANVSAYLQGQIWDNDADILGLQSQTQTISGNLDSLEAQFNALDFTYATDINLANVSAYLQGQITSNDDDILELQTFTDGITGGLAQLSPHFNIPADDDTLEDVFATSATPSATGLTSTIASATWGDSAYIATGLNTGSYADDALGSIINSGNALGEQTFSLLFGNATTSSASKVYFSSDRSDLASVGVCHIKYGLPSVDAVYEGSITTIVGTEYVYSFDISTEIGSDPTFFQPRPTDSTAFYVRLWDSNPLELTEIIRAKDGGITEAKLSTELQDKINNHPTYENLANVSGNLQGQITTNDADILGLQSQTQTISGDLDSLEIQFNALDFTYATDINLANISANLQGQITSNDVDIAGLQSQTQTISGDLDSLEITVANLNDIYATNINLANVSASLEAQITNLGDGYATDTELTNVSGGLQAQLDQLDDTFVNVTGDVMTGNLEISGAYIKASQYKGLGLPITSYTSPSLSGAFSTYQTSGTIILDATLGDIDFTIPNADTENKGDVLKILKIGDNIANIVTSGGQNLGSITQQTIASDDSYKGFTIMNNDGGYLVVQDNRFTSLINNLQDVYVDQSGDTMTGDLSFVSGANVYIPSLITDNENIVQIRNTDGKVISSELQELYVPVEEVTSSNATGVKGQWSYGLGYYYKCVATNTWVKYPVITDVTTELLEVGSLSVVSLTGANGNFLTTDTTGLLIDSGVSSTSSSGISGGLSQLDARYVNVDGDTMTGILNMGASIIPTISGAYDLGSLLKPFKDLYVTGNSIYIDGLPLTLNDNKLNFNGEELSTTNLASSISANLQAQILTNDADILGLHSQTQTISGDLDSLEITVANLNDIYATDINLANVSASLEAQITNLGDGYATDIELFNVSGNLQGQISSNDADILELQTNTTGISGGITQLDDRFVNVDGDIMTGDLTLNANAFVNGTITINGDILQISGGNTTQIAEILQIQDNMAVLNYGETGFGVSVGEAGAQIDRGQLDDYFFIFKETLRTETEVFAVGASGNLQIVATRQDDPVANSLSFWNDTEKRFDSIDEVTWDDASKSLDLTRTTPDNGPILDVTVRNSGSDGNGVIIKHSSAGGAQNGTLLRLLNPVKTTEATYLSIDEGFEIRNDGSPSSQWFVNMTNIGGIELMPPVSITGEARLAFNGGTDKVQISENGGDWTNLNDDWALQTELFNVSGNLQAQITDNDADILALQTSQIGISGGLDQLDDRYVNVDGDTVTGNLVVEGDVAISGNLAIPSLITENENVTQINSSGDLISSELQELYVPVEEVTSSNATGVKGQWSYGLGYYYKCVATNTWIKISAITSF